MKNLPQLPNIHEEQQTPHVKALLGLLEQYSERIVLLEQTVSGLKDEINILKGEKRRPGFKPSGMDKSADKQARDTKNKNKRLGSNKSKRSKTSVY